jgi:O-antigen/teichoic acid export membrane protein
MMRGFHAVIRRIASNSLAFDMSVIFGGFGLQLITQIGWLLLAVRFLGPDGYGVFAGLTGLTFTVGCFVGWGSAPLLVRGVGAEPEKLLDWIGHAVLLITLTGVFLTVILMCVLPLMDFGSLSVAALGAVVLSDVLFGRYASLCVNIHMATARASRQSAVSVITGMCRLVAMGLACLVNKHLTLSVWAWWYLTSTILSAFICFSIVVRHHGWPRFRFVPGTLRLGFAFSAENAVQSAMKDLDKLIVLQILGPLAAGYYATAFRIVDTLLIPIYALAFATYGRMFKKAAESRSACIAYGAKLLPLALALGSVVGGCALIGAGLLPIIFGSAYADLPWMVRLLTPMPAIMGAFLIGADVLSAIGKQEARLAVVALSLAAMLASCWWSVMIFGLDGAIIARIIVAFVTTVVVWTLVYGPRNIFHSAATRRS